jgi:hypothetical protein
VEQTLEKPGRQTKSRALGPGIKAGLR